MGFLEAVKTCFAKYFVFSGRARRPEYWWFYLFGILLGIVTSVVDLIIFPPVAGADPRDVSAISPINAIASLAILVPSLSVAWRRMHDIGRPGYQIFMPILPLIPAVVFFFLTLQSPGGGEIYLYTAIGFFALTLIAQIVVIVWLASRSQSGENQFGPEPGVGVNVEGVFE